MTDGMKVSMNLAIPKGAQTKTTNYQNGNRLEEIYVNDKKVIEQLFNSEENFPISTREFDSNGNTIRSMQEFDGDGYADDIYETTYDELGRKTSVEHKDGNGEVVYSQKTIYDENPASVRILTDKDGDGIDDIMNYSEYDKNGNLTFNRYMSLTEDTEQFDTAVQYVYDINGNVSGEAFYSNDKMQMTNRYLNGQKMSSSYYNEDGTLSSRNEYYYDDLGNPTGTGVDDRGQKAWWDIFGLFVKKEPDGIIDYVIENGN